MTRSFDVFLSHNSRDKPAVRELAEALQDRGLKVWLDEWELVPGRPWQEALEEVIEITGASAVLVGKDGLGPWHNKEMRGSLSEFVDRNLPVIPVLLPGAPEKPVLPIFLKGFTWVDLRGGLTEEGLDRLQWGITGERPARSKRPVTPTSAPAQELPQQKARARWGASAWLGLFTLLGVETEITNKQYRSFRQKNQGEDELPVVNVSWAEAQEACEHFGGRLPTEAEWEYAARAGSQTAWSFGDDEKLLGESAWYSGNSGGTLHPVRTRKANVWGLHDMHGNVWEWVADWYGTYPASVPTDPTDPTAGKYRVLRGGAFDDPPRFLRSTFRYRVEPGYRDRVIGFRCARSPRRQL